MIGYRTSRKRIHEHEGPPAFSSSPAGNRRANQRGTAMFEYAIVVLISLMMLFGIVDFGRALYAYHFISNAAREGTRFASVRGNTCTFFASDCPATRGQIRAFVKNVPQGIDAAALTVTPNFTNPNGLPVCGSSQNYPGCGVQVRVDYNFRFIFPLMPVPIAMSSTSEMIISR
jgi:Flp pilus assembly protein TadG